MARSHNFAGIFFADHRVIWATAYAEIGRYAAEYPAMVFDTSPDFINDRSSKANRFEAHPTDAQNDIDRAVMEILEYLGPDQFKNLISVTTASIGPFQDGKSGNKTGGHIISGARSPKWSGFDLHAAVSASFSKLGNDSIEVRCITDAEAMVAGEHYFYRQYILSSHRRDSGAFQKQVENLGEDTVAYLLVDSGVGGAIFKRNNFVRGEASLEIGHMPIYAVPIPEIATRYPANSCGGHFMPCLEGTISLPALEHKWGLNWQKLQNLGTKSEELDWLAFFLAQAVFQITLFHTPTVVLLGGGVIDLGGEAQSHALIKRVREHYRYLSRNVRANEDWGGNLSVSDQLFPNYLGQRKHDYFVQKWSNRDSGVLGCLVWSFKTISGRFTSEANV